MSTEIWKKRPQYMSLRGDSDGDVRATWAGPIRTQLYGDQLQDLCSLTHNNMLRIRSSMVRVDPCLENGIDHWHSDDRPSSAASYNVKSPNKDVVSWHNPSVMFASSNSLQSLASQPDSDTASVVSSTAPHTFCYLCSTMEEHKKHQLRLKSARRTVKPGRPRVSYVAPRPRVKAKSPEPTEVAEVLYRIEVFTGSVADSGTNASVFIQLHGKHDSSKRTQLKNGRGSSRFCFVRGSKETFYYKGPKLGDLSYITVEHEPAPPVKQRPASAGQQDRAMRAAQRPKRDHWYLDYIVVTNMQTDQSWEFVCKDWLCRMERDIEAAVHQKHVRDLEVSVVTGKKRLAGTDAKVYLTMYGKQGGNSGKIHLPDDKNHKRFERSHDDKFNLRDIRDFGEITRIRIEHDGSGMASGWNLDSVTIQDINDRTFHYTFHYGGWIATDVGDGRLWRELRAQTKQDKEIHHGSPYDQLQTKLTETLFSPKQQLLEQ